MNVLGVIIFVGAMIAAFIGKRLTVSRSGPVRLPEENIHGLPGPVARAMTQRERRLRFVIVMDLSWIEEAVASERMLYDKTVAAARASLIRVRRMCPGMVPGLISDTPIVRVEEREPGFIATVEWKTRAQAISNTFKVCVERALRSGEDGDRIRGVRVSIV